MEDEEYEPLELKGKSVFEFTEMLITFKCTLCGIRVYETHNRSKLIPKISLRRCKNEKCKTNL